MKKLHTFALYALVTPAITLGAGSVLAQQSTGADSARQHQSTQRDQDAPLVTHGSYESERGVKSDAKKTADRSSMRNQTSKENRGHIASVPAQGMRANDLMGATVSTAADKNVGPVNDLVIDKDGQVVAIVVSVGGFLGMGEKDVAIGWDNVTTSGTSGTSGTSDNLTLHVDVSREDLSSAPEFKKQD